jgi:D-glycero-alpha-D-manno-heptose-7-phosphate kinase
MEKQARIFVAGSFTSIGQALMQQLEQEGISILDDGQDIVHCGELLDEAWKAKSAMGAKASNSYVDEIYSGDRTNGAIGGKLLGAGGGGFMVLFVHPSQQAKVKERLNQLIHVPFKFESSGCQIIFYNPEDDYSDQGAARANQAVQVSRELAHIQEPE